MEDYFKNLQYVSSNDECLENYTDSLSTPNKIPKVFYHYTSIEAFQGIINNKNYGLQTVSILMILVKLIMDLTTYQNKYQTNSKQSIFKDSFNTWKSSFDANLEHRYVCCFSKIMITYLYGACIQGIKDYVLNLKETISN